MIVVCTAYDHDGTAGDDTRVTKFTYDDQSRETSRTLPIGVSTTGDLTDFVETKNYDALGRMTYQVSFEGVVTAYVYDDADGLDTGDAGRVVAKHYYDAPNAESNYLADAVPVSGYVVLDASDETVAYEYDAWGRKTEVTQTLTTHTRVTRNVYGDRGRLLVVAADVDGDGDLDQQLQYDYDPVNGQTPAPHNPRRQVPIALGTTDNGEVCRVVKWNRSRRKCKAGRILVEPLGMVSTRDKFYRVSVRALPSFHRKHGRRQLGVGENSFRRVVFLRKGFR